jgi:hypothetical protein
MERAQRSESIGAWPLPSDVSGAGAVCTAGSMVWASTDSLASAIAAAAGASRLAPPACLRSGSRLVIPWCWGSTVLR